MVTARTAYEANRCIDGQLMKRLLGAGLNWLERNEQNVNRLNVFPVPDGDTGTNMLLTMREAYHQIGNRDDLHLGKICREIAYGALNGARGNSGTILSQLWQGFARAVENESEIDADKFIAGWKAAVDAAYKAVITPVEGTILTVARESMETAVARYDAGERDMVMLLKVIAFGARRSLRRTPELLPVLRDAGVVDSGGAGLVAILEGMERYISGKAIDYEVTLEATQNTSHWKQALEPEDKEGYGYDVQFRIHGTNLDVEGIRAAIDQIGWSTLVVGNDRLVKVHVHVHDPGKPLSYAIALGMEIDDVVVENMQMQYQQFVAEREGRERGEEAKMVEGVAVIAVAPGGGLKNLFTDELGAARVVTGGQTMNPSTGEFLNCIASLPNTEIVILPNNKNIFLAAKQAAEATKDRQVRVIPSRTVPQGISAMVEYNILRESGEVSLDEMAEGMQEALRNVISAEITTATRTVEIGGVSVSEGQLIGLLEGELVIAGEDMEQVMRDLLYKAKADKREIITLYYGNNTHRAKAQALVDVLSPEFSKQEFQVVFGGQALYPYIISIE